MPLYSSFIHNLLNVLVQITNKMRFKKKLNDTITWGLKARIAETEEMAAARQWLYRHVFLEIEKHDTTVSWNMHVQCINCEEFAWCCLIVCRRKILGTVSFNCKFVAEMHKFSCLVCSWTKATELVSNFNQECNVLITAHHHTSWTSIHSSWPVTRRHRESRANSSICCHFPLRTHHRRETEVNWPMHYCPGKSWLLIQASWSFVLEGSRRKSWTAQSISTPWKQVG
jgi:hypothetical protein